jgi:integrase
VHAKDGGKVLRFRQNKTGRLIDSALVGQLGDLVAVAIGEVPQIRQPIVHTMAGEPYSYSGISAMLKRAQKKAKVTAFGFRDLKGKGATDMWLTGVPIEQIQLLCGHASKTTTERYIKARWRETAQPNRLEIGR